MAIAPRKVILPGGSGFLGAILAGHFERRGYDVVVLSRRPANARSSARHVLWDARTLGAWRHELEGAALVVNLAGRSVNCRYHARNRRAILSSRVESTRVVGAAIASCSLPPAVWMNASTATIYKHSFDRPMDEATGRIAATPAAKDQFSIEVAQAWEQAFDDARTPATRKLALRTGMVFGRCPGTVYEVLRRLARFRLGGPMAGGRQFVSWIHERDFCRAIEWLADHDDLCGPVNVVAPNPITNREMMRTIRAALGIRLGLPATRWMLEVGAVFLRTETELIIKSRWVVPARLAESEFRFQFPDFSTAVAELENRRSERPSAGAYDDFVEPSARNPADENSADCLPQTIVS